jgi:hypothetical protein
MLAQYFLHFTCIPIPVRLKAGFEDSKFIVSQNPLLDTVILHQFYLGIYVG